MTYPHPENLARHLNFLLNNETRPLARIDRYQHGNGGVKRTHLLSAVAIPAQSAGALAIKQQTQTTVANQGNTAWGQLKPGPLTAEAINQGQLADCYLLIAMWLIARLRPNFFDDIFIKLDEQTAVVQWYYQGYILQIKTSLLISTDYDHPSNGDIRPELAEKTWCLIKAALSDYAADNFGYIYSVFTAFGLDGSIGVTSADSVIAAMQAGKCVGLQTTPTASGNNSLEAWVESHAYGVVGFDAAKNLTLCQPWYAVREITGVAPATVLPSAGIFNLMHQGAFPATPRILAGMVNVPAVPATPTVPAPTTSPIPTPTETTMPIDATLKLNYAPVTGGQKLQVTFDTNADTITAVDDKWKVPQTLIPSSGFMIGVIAGQIWTFTANRKDGGKPAVQTIIIPSAIAINQAARTLASVRIVATPVYSDGTEGAPSTQNMPV